MLAEEVQVDLDYCQRQQKEWTQDLKREVSGHTAAVEEGDLVDALDSSKFWRAAKIVKKEERQVMVEFVGWEERWNEPIPLTGSRIKPFRTESLVDTSSTKGAYTGRVQTLLHETEQVNYCHLDPKYSLRGELLGYSYCKRHQLMSERSFFIQTPRNSENRE
jgi:hypothetical protein